jgi:hypothetical protein
LPPAPPHGALPPAPPPRNLFEKRFLGTSQNFDRPKTAFSAKGSTENTKRLSLCQTAEEKPFSCPKRSFGPFKVFGDCQEPFFKKVLDRGSPRGQAPSSHPSQTFFSKINISGLKSAIIYYKIIGYGT